MKNLSKIKQLIQILEDADKMIADYEKNYRELKDKAENLKKTTYDALRKMI